MNIITILKSLSNLNIITENKMLDQDMKTKLKNHKMKIIDLD